MFTLTVRGSTLVVSKRCKQHFLYLASYHMYIHKQSPTSTFRLRCEMPLANPTLSMLM